MNFSKTPRSDEDALKLVIFDCDGTIIDSQDIIIQAMTMAFKKADIAVPTAASIRGIIGLSLEEAVMTVAGLQDQPNDTLCDHLIEGYKQAFVTLRNQADHNEPMYQGARDVIESLAGRDDILLGIATGKSRKGLDVVLERENLSQHFHILKTADDAPSKPHPGMIDQAIKEMGVSKNQTVMIGDTSFDMVMAHNAGVMGIGVEWGYHDNEQLSHAHHIAKDYPHLLDLMETNFFKG